MPIVEATGTATGTSRHAQLAKRIEQAMAAAVMDALADGVPMDDTEEILRRKQAARRAVLDETYTAK